MLSLKQIALDVAATSRLIGGSSNKKSKNRPQVYSHALLLE